jgi:hypothetical protein
MDPLFFGLKFPSSGMKKIVFQINGGNKYDLTSSCP